VIHGTLPCDEGFWAINRLFGGNPQGDEIILPAMS
jgi:hypothetical protein